MLLSLLNKEEKVNFVDLLIKLVNINGEVSDADLSIIKKYKNEMGDDISKVKKSTKSKDQLITYFKDKSETIRNLIYLNLVAASLNDIWYSVEEHFLLEEIQNAFNISDKKRIELMKLVYSERDLREKVKRVISEK